MPRVFDGWRQQDGAARRDEQPGSLKSERGRRARGVNSPPPPHLYGATHGAPPRSLKNEACAVCPSAVYAAVEA